jgi:hypothetical protein
MTSKHDHDQPRDDRARDEHGRRSGVAATGPEVRATLIGNGTPMGPDAVSSLESAIRSAHSKAGVHHSGIHKEVCRDNQTAAQDRVRR